MIPEKHGEKLGLPVDVDERIFQNSLQGPCFQAWRQIDRRWQLHISGGPGSGKSTFAALAARRLRREVAVPVVLIHVHDDEPSMATGKPSLYDATPPHDHAIYSNRVSKHERFPTNEAINISSSCTDFEELYIVLDNQVYKSDGLYLIIDGFDRFHKSIQGNVQQNLRLLEAQGLRILLLNAASELDSIPLSIVSCNSCGHGSRENEEKDGLQIYWTCDLCEYDLCDMCKTDGKHCHDHNHTMSEPYDVVNMRLDAAPSELKNYVRVDLETEYGTGINNKIIDDIYEPSDGNINLIKLRLDRVRNLGAPQDVLSATDRLPREVVAFFDSEVKHLIGLAPPKRYQTLLALIAIAAAEEEGCMSVSKLEKLLKYASDFKLEETGSAYPYVRQVLQSGRGLLSSIIIPGNIPSIQQESDRLSVTLYVKDLGWYIREDYNEHLVLAKQYLSQVVKGERKLDHNSAFEKMVDARKRDLSNLDATLPREQKAVEGLSQVLSIGIVDVILQEPGDICGFCLRSMFQSGPNSGTRTWPSQDRKTKCPICCYAYTELADMHVISSEFHWTRRTMGRTSDSYNDLVLTLSTNNKSTQTTHRRFVFMLKSKLGFLPEPSDLGKTTGLEHAGKQIKKWLHTCATDHAHCLYRKTQLYVPKRLIEIDVRRLGHFRVIKREEKIEGPYVTLSHCWGRSPDFLTLTTENKHELMTKGFSASELKNKNFKEAIEVARYIGVKYIWIDSLCICQSGKDKDFKEEGQYMHLVYQNSFCNIVAADSRDANGGLFRDRPEYSLSSTNTKGSWVVLDKELWTKELLQSNIYTRGWVFQERMLSPRLIHFTRSQVFWDCSTLSACESLPQGLPFALSAIATTDRRWRSRLQRKNSGQDNASLTLESSLESFWEAAVLNYTSCELTNFTDKTIALWSVAKLVRDNLQPADQYGCGLWSIALHEQLAWHVKVVKRGARMDALQSVFPSWSWASVNAPIQVKGRLVVKGCYTIRNHEGDPIGFGDFKGKAVNKDLQPQFTASDSLAVRGHLIPGHLGRDPTDGTHVFKTAEIDIAQNFEVMVDEELPEALLELFNLHLMPLVARKTKDDESTYSGSALVLIATNDYRQLAQSKLMNRVFCLANSYEACSIVGTAHADQKSELRRLRLNIDALNAYLHKVAKQDRELPCRRGNAFRRVGVVQFNDVAVGDWAKIRAKKEKMIWID